MKLIAQYAFVAMLATASGFGQAESTTALAQASQIQPSQAQAFAESVLQMKDNGEYSAMYNRTFHPKMRQTTEAQWITTATKMAQQNGILKSRRLRTVEPEVAGGYKVTYDAAYSNAGPVIEIVEVAVRGEMMRVVGLFVRKSPSAQ